MSPNPKTPNQLVGSDNLKSEHNVQMPPRPRLSMDHGLQRTVSDTTFELNKEPKVEPKEELPPISEVENAKCECCGMCEECTKEYINRVRGMFSGKLICGLCAAAVNEEMEKNGGKRAEALEEHMSACLKFNSLGRSYPVLYQAEAIKEILKKSSSRSRAKSMSPKDNNKSKGGQNKAGIGIARSSSCIPAISREQVGGSAVMKNFVA